MNHLKEKKLNVNTVAIFNILGPVILNGINFFTIPVFTRLLGTENYGLYTIYYTWVNTFTILVSLQASGTIGVANVRMEGKQKLEYYSSIMFMILCSFFVILSIIIVGMNFFADMLGLPAIIVILILIHALGMAFVNFATIRYTYEKRSYITFTISVGVAVAGIVLSLYLFRANVLAGPLYYSRALGSAFPYLFLGIGICIMFVAQGRTFFSKTYWGFCLPLCLPMIFHGLSQLILGQADRVMLQNMMSESVVGIYSFTYTFANVLNIIYNAFNNTWVPFYYDDIHSGNIAQIHKRSKNYIFIFTALSMGFMLLAPDVIKLFAGEEFWDGIGMLPVLVLANYMIFLYSFPVNYEFYHKKSIHIATGTTSAAVLNCVLNYFLIRRIGMSGAAVATLISYILLWLFHHLVSKYIIKENYHYRIKQFMPALIVMIICSVYVYLLQDNIILRWAAALVVGVVALRHLVKTKTIF